MGRPRAVPEDVLSSALERAEPDTSLMLLLGAYAGLRRVEIAAVHGQHVTAGGLVVQSRGGRVRVVPLHPRLAPRLRTLEGWAFPAHGAEAVAHASPEYVDRQVAAALGRPWGAPSLRYRFASRAYRGSRDLRTVLVLLGHARTDSAMPPTLLPDRALIDAVLSL
jgi:integrase/recombinase XerC